MPSKKILHTIKEKLEKERQDILQRLSQKHDIDSDGDETDEVQANIQNDLNNKFTGLAKLKLTQIDDALARIDNKSYGVCVECDESIAEKRLLANPHSTMCVSCAEDRELTLKRKGL